MSSGFVAVLKTLEFNFYFCIAQWIWFIPNPPIPSSHLYHLAMKFVLVALWWLAGLRVCLNIGIFQYTVVVVYLLSAARRPPPLFFFVCVCVCGCMFFSIMCKKKMFSLLKTLSCFRAVKHNIALDLDNTLSGAQNFLYPEIFFPQLLQNLCLVSSTSFQDQ